MTSNDLDCLFQVSLLSLEDGRSDIARAARRLAERVSAGAVAADSIDEDAVADALQERSRSNGQPIETIRVVIQ